MKKTTALAAALVMVTALVVSGCGKKTQQQVQVPAPVQQIQQPVQTPTAPPTPVAEPAPSGGLPTVTPPAPREVVLVKGLLHDYLEAGSDYSIYKKSIGQKIVQGVSWKDHPQKVGILMERIHGWMEIKAAGTYMFRMVGKEIPYASLLVDGVAYTPQPSGMFYTNRDVELPLATGMHEISFFLGVKDSKGGIPFETTFSPKGMPLRALTNGSYPNAYTLYYDKSELQNPVESVEKIFKIEESVTAPDKSATAPDKSATAPDLSVHSDKSKSSPAKKKGK
ncbi:MAG: hypothetical protein ACYC69_02655 [Thermodesulfovibrionales bacterium]